MSEGVGILHTAPADFRARHAAVLERNEARHMMMLGVLHGADAELAGVQFWTLGGSGECAILRPNGLLILGDVNARQSRTFAEQLSAQQPSSAPYNGVIGPDDSALRFVERAAQLGVAFLDPMPQRIHSLAELPNHPGAPGHARRATTADAELLTAWMAAFVHEATPHDSPPSSEIVEKGAAEGRYFMWMVGNEPVSTAAIVRRTRHTGGIAAVFTPKDLRGRGYAGSITAAVVEALFREGKTMACINTDLRNPISNRCYAKIGFQPVCDVTFFPRRVEA
jgi:RimJ/RimL family protein N-acetyltransferase